MRLITTARAKDGMEIGRDVLVGHPDGVPLLRAGVCLTPRYRELLVRAGVSAIYIEDEASAGISIDHPLDDRARAVATRAVATAYQTARDAFTHDRRLSPESVSALQHVVEMIMSQIELSGGAAMALADLSTADGYTFQHSIDVTAVGLVVGHRYFKTYGWVDYRGERQFGRINERLSTLGLGLLLHDIGKLAVPLGILNKPGRLTAEEWEIMKTHPRAGIDMLAGNEWSPLVKSVVLRHHERWDGSGYPDRKHGEQIHQLARVAAVADVYDAITSERLYAPARPAADGVRAILEGSGKLFDPQVCEAFRQVVAPFPAGTEVELTDGRRALVVSAPEEALDRPVVRTLDENDQPQVEIALEGAPGLGIRGWDPTPLAASVAA